MNLLILYAEFFQMGLFAVGGGLATLPFFFRLADKYEWLNPEQIGNMLAIVQSSPGALGVNMSAQAGYYAAGIPGAVLAPLGLISPAIIVIVIAARMFAAFKENQIAAAVFTGLRPAATGLLTAAGFSAWKLSLYNPAFTVWHELLRWKECLLLILLFLGISRLKFHPIIYVIISGAAGVVFKL
ncbi:MAG: chromate transporter [Treponema sp.]|jgi:chromate transporter|nr:chromate transporter [Treponema sp.]